uniref:Interleukin n=1 Tax=Echeneis naucrates TaxID=173247 RepID=A0A665U7R4_ECHNA
MVTGRQTLVVVFMCFVCLPSLKQQEADDRICTQDIVKTVQQLILKAPGMKWLESRLYTPTITDYKKCPSSTVKCFAAEIKVLTEEWKIFNPEFKKFKLNLLLGELATLFNKTEVECPQCELLKEQDAEKFLRYLLSTLQAINTEYC